MVFDEDLSTKVSLPRVLDHFISSGEDPNTIFGFLELHPDKIKDILRYSDCSPRLLSLDFVGKLSVKQNERFAKILKVVSDNEVECMLWQIFFSKRADETVKGIYRPLMGDKTSPYRGRLGGEVLEYDRLLIDSSDASDYSVAIDSMDNLNIMKYINKIDMSVVVQRIFQEDVFCRIDPVKQFVVLNSLPLSRDFPISVFKGLKQLVGGGLDTEIKLAICEIFKKRPFVSSSLNRLMENQISDIMETDPRIGTSSNKKTFNQIAMKIGLKGSERYCDWILFYLLYENGLDFFKGFSFGNRRLFEKYFDILDII